MPPRLRQELEEKQQNRLTTVLLEFDDGVLLALLIPTSQFMQTKVLITIDTEVRTHGRPDAFDHDVAGRSQSNSRGAYWIADQLKSYGFAGVFFLDVYGSGRFRGAPYRELCEGLLERGQDIQLHTHPDQMYDSKRRNMHEYSLAEQTGIVRDGMALLKDWTGKSPIAHRAGSYGANEDTLKALRVNGILLDSSFFYGRANCKLPFGNSNSPFKSHDVWEIPVTIAPEPVEKLGFRFPFWTRHFWKRYIKLDVNAMCPIQICRSVRQLHGAIPYMITFLHSFSFMRWKTDEPDERAIASFHSLLRLLADMEIPVVTFEQIAAELGVDSQGVPRPVIRA